MTKRKKAKIFAAAAISLVCAAVIVAIVLLSNVKPFLTFSVGYYFVCYREQDDAQSASSISSTVESLGGAGYIVEVDGRYYITVACYYTQSDAQSVCENLELRGLTCSTLAAERDRYSLTTARARDNSEKYLNNLSVLYNLSKTLYGAANSLDSGSAGQEQAKAILEFAKTTLCGLALENADNCFRSEIDYLIAECEDVSYGFIKSSSLRALQIAIADCVLNINLC
ncbi:MAG: hypothetical protein ACI4MH_05225 [Candidatus Coproplasma sp.]